MVIRIRRLKGWTCAQNARRPEIMDARKDANLLIGIRNWRLVAGGRRGYR